MSRAVAADIESKESAAKAVPRFWRQLIGEDLSCVAGARSGRA